jgi:hypothetical protein
MLRVKIAMKLRMPRALAASSDSGYVGNSDRMTG